MEATTPTQDGYAGGIYYGEHLLDAGPCTKDCPPITHVGQKCAGLVAELMGFESPVLKASWVLNPRSISGSIVILQNVLQAALLSPEWARAFIEETTRLMADTPEEYAEGLLEVEESARLILERLRVQYSAPVDRIWQRVQEGMGDA